MGFGVQRVSVRGLIAGAFVLIGTTNGMSADKTQYSLFNPTPDRLLRDMTTDRPDTTESPFTVDAGHMQIETNLFAYARSRPDADGTVTDSYEFATTNVRIGLTNNAERSISSGSPMAACVRIRSIPSPRSAIPALAASTFAARSICGATTPSIEPVLHWPCYPSSPCLPTTTTASALSTPRAT